MDFKDSKTFENVQSAFEGESKASTKYAIYGLKAREDGYEQMGDIFDETSRNEREHAELFFKLLNDGEVPNTLHNLKASYEGESYEHTTMYPEFAKQAREEGFNDIAALFDGIARIEAHHNYRFRELAKNIETNIVFCKDIDTVWLCLICGNVEWGKCAPKICPVCHYPQGFYEVNCENY